MFITEETVDRNRMVQANITTLVLPLSEESFSLGEKTYSFIENVPEEDFKLLKDNINDIEFSFDYNSFWTDKYTYLSLDTIIIFEEELSEIYVPTITPTKKYFFIPVGEKKRGGIIFDLTLTVDPSSVDTVNGFSGDRLFFKNIEPPYFYFVFEIKDDVRIAVSQRKIYTKEVKETLVDIKETCVILDRGIAEFYREKYEVTKVLTLVPKDSIGDEVTSAKVKLNSKTKFFYADNMARILRENSSNTTKGMLEYEFGFACKPSKILGEIADVELISWTEIDSDYYSDDEDEEYERETYFMYYAVFGYMVKNK